MPFDIFGVQPFAGTPFWVVGLTALAHFAGFVIRGAFGFGSNLPIIILTALLLGPHHAIVLVVLTATFSQIHLFPQGVRGADWRLVGALVTGVYVGIAIGTWVFVSLSADALAPVLGALVVGIVLMDRFDVIRRIGSVIDLKAWTTVAPLSVVSGFVGTASGGGGIYFLAPFLKHVLPEPVRFRCTNLVLSGVFMFGRAGFFLIAGMLDWRTTVEALLLMPAVFLGGVVGSRWAKAVAPEAFFRGLSMMLLIGAALLAGKSIA